MAATEGNMAGAYPAPKFQVGEEVLVCNSRQPFVGIVLSRTWNNTATGFVYETPLRGGWGYTVSNDPFTNEGDYEWLECKLQKRHKPGDMSFADLMQSLTKKSRKKTVPMRKVAI